MSSPARVLPSLVTSGLSWAFWPADFYQSCGTQHAGFQTDVLKPRLRADFNRTVVCPYDYSDTRAFGDQIRSALLKLNPLWTHSGQTSKHFFSPNCRPATFSVPCCGLHPSQVSKLCKLSFVRSECSCVWEPLCVCVCVCVHLELSLWTRFCTLQIL